MQNYIASCWPSYLIVVGKLLCCSPLKMKCSPNVNIFRPVACYSSCLFPWSDFGTKLFICQLFFPVYSTLAASWCNFFFGLYLAFPNEEAVLLQHMPSAYLHAVLGLHFHSQSSWIDKAYVFLDKKDLEKVVNFCFR